MSEFSESYHLRSDDRADAVALLERAQCDGWVVTAGNGWVTFVVSESFRGAPNDQVVAANEHALLYYMNAEDHASAFRVFNRATDLGGVICSWDPEFEITADTFDRAQVQAVLTHASTDAAIDAMLQAEPGDVLLTNPGHRFAALLELPAYEWLAGDYVERDGGSPDMIEVRATGAPDVEWIAVEELPRARALAQVPMPDLGPLRDQLRAASDEDLDRMAEQLRAASPEIAALPEAHLGLVVRMWREAVNYQPPAGVEVPVGAETHDGPVSRDDTAWRFRTVVRGADAASLNDELLRRARAQGYDVEQLPDESRWSRGETTVRARVEQGDRGIEVRLTSPA
jgi:hypothetical protein